MTSLVAVLAVDQRGPCALYLMTDSRITWIGHDGEWDAGQKTFFAGNKAHVFGFCGNASFPPSVARQLVEQVEAGIIGTGNDPDVVHAEIKVAVEWAHSVATNKFFDGFSLFHGYREGEYMGSKFHLRRIQYYASTNKIYSTKIEIDADTSCLAHIDGSGASIIRQFRAKRQGEKEPSTSRAAILTFYEALASGQDAATGGAPQMVGIWRKGPAQRFGIIWKGDRYVAGLKISEDIAQLGHIHWFDDSFNSLKQLPAKRVSDEPAE